MTLKDIAVKNLLRRKGKAGFILAGLVVGVATVVAVMTYVEAMTRDINHKLEKFGANILIVPRTENLTLSYGGMSLGGVSFEMQEIKQAELERVQAIENARNIAAMGPMALGVVQINGRKALLAGIDYEAAAILKPWWRVQGQFPVSQSSQTVGQTNAPGATDGAYRDGVVLGAEAARVMNLSRNQIIELNGYPLIVSGILQPTGSQDDQMVFARLDTAQIVLDKPGRVSMVEVAALCEACPIEEMVRQIATVLPGAKVMAIQQVVKSRMETLSQFRKFSYGISVVVIFIGSLVVLVTMMGSVRERTEEIGIFRAIGFRKAHIIRIVFMESGIISVLAGITGYLTGFLAAFLILRFYSAKAVAALAFDPQLLAGAVVLALLTGLAASAYPALIASRMDPNDALRAM